MSEKITNSQIADKIRRYFTLQRTVLRSLNNTGDMPLSHYQVLSILNERGQMRMGEMSDFIAISKPNLTPLVDKLFELNYVERIATNYDRRVTFIAITATGREALKSEHTKVVDGLSQITNNLSDEEREKFSDALDFMIEIFSKF